jgi:hypothetical protein
MIAMLPAAAAAMPASPPSSLPSQDLEAPDHNAIMKTLASLEGLSPTLVPSTQSVQEAAQMRELAASLATFKIRLPNTKFQLDLRTLNLHLAQRTSEILACAEAMWDWVLEYQAEIKRQKKNGRVRASSMGRMSSMVQFSQGGQALDSTKTTISELTRPEFDGLLTQFNL